MSASECCGAAWWLVVVDDPERALLDLASWWRGRLGARVVAITGSVGKTTTKELLAAALAPHRSVVATPLNRNTRLGVALTLLDARAGTEVVVLEVGGSAGPDEIARTCRLARPDIGIVTSVRPVHLETMGGIEAIARSKADLRVLDATAHGLDGLTVRAEVGGRSVRADLPFLGDHAAVVVAAALMTAEVLGVAAEDAVRGMPAPPLRGRRRIPRGSGRVLRVSPRCGRHPRDATVGGSRTTPPTRGETP